MTSESCISDLKDTQLLSEDNSLKNKEGENDFTVQKAGLKEKVYFFCAGSTGYTNILITVGCYPILANAYNEYLYGFYAFLFGNLATFTYPVILYLLRKLPYNYQINTCMLICFACVVNMVLMVTYFPHNRIACYSLYLTHNISMASGFTLQNQASHYLKYYDYSLIPYFYSAISFATIIVTAIGFLVVDLNATSFQYLITISSIITIFMITCYLFQVKVTRSDTFKRAEIREKNMEKTQGYTPTELWTTMKTIKWYFTAMLFIFITYASIYPSVTSKMGPPSVTFEKWSNIQLFLGSSAALLGSWLVFDSKKTKGLVNLLTQYSTVFCIWTMVQFVTNDRELMNRLWVLNVSGTVLLCFHYGFYLNYLMRQVVLLFQNDKRSMFLMNYAVSYGYLLGSLLTVVLAELRDRIHNIIE